MNAGADPDHIADWLEALMCARATTVVREEGATAVLHADFPQAHDHNLVAVRGDPEPPLVVDLAERVLGGAGLGHRLIQAPEGWAARASPFLVGLGYAREDSMIMRLPADVVVRGPLRTAETLDLDERAAAATDDWRRDQPDWPPATAEQLGRRVHTLPASVDARFLVVRGADGEVVARTDLYLSDGVAQIEEVVTAESARNQGHASTLLRAAIAQARGARAGTVFLIADRDDWPRRFYARLGFETVATSASFTCSST